MLPTISMETYKPSEKALNQALWGSDKASGKEETTKQLEELNKRFTELRDRAKPKE
jgi:hypothetical protein